MNVQNVLVQSTQQLFKHVTHNHKCPLKCGSSVKTLCSPKDISCIKPFLASRITVDKFNRATLSCDSEQHELIYLGLMSGADAMCVHPL